MAQSAKTQIPNFIRNIEAPDWSNAAVLLYGRGGVGKTTAATGAPAGRRIIIDVEGGCKKLTGPSAEVQSLEQLDILTSYLAKMDHPYEVVILDGLDALYELTYEALKGKSANRDSRSNHIEPIARMVPSLRRFVALPMLKIVTAHSKRESEDGLHHTNIALPPALRDKVEQMFDVIAYCRKSDTSSRQMICEHTLTANGSVYGKDRTGVFGATPRPLAWASLAKGLGL
jgi:hypothetical protein